MTQETAKKAWADFKAGRWKNKIDTEDFIRTNFTGYNGDHSFLKGPTKRTQDLWKKCEQLLKQEFKKGGVLDIDTKTISTITSHRPGYIDKDKELIKGLQTDAPLKRAIKPFGGIRLVEKACSSYGYTLDPKVTEIFTRYRRTHNEGVFNSL